MRTLAAVLFVLALGVSFTMVASSGVGPTVFGQDAEDRGGLGPMEKLNESGDDTEDYNISGDVAGEEERNIVGFIIDGGQFLMSLVAAVVLVPGVLMALGFPSYFALPTGIVVQIVAVIGAIQFATNRNYR